MVIGFTLGFCLERSGPVAARRPGDLAAVVENPRGVFSVGRRRAFEAAPGVVYAGFR